MYNLTPSKLLPAFAKSAFGKADCNIKEILSVGGFLTDATERYLIERQERRQMLTALNALNLLVEKNQKMAEDLGINKRRKLK